MADNIFSNCLEKGIGRSDACSEKGIYLPCLKVVKNLQHYLRLDSRGLTEYYSRIYFFYAFSSALCLLTILSSIIVSGATWNIKNGPVESAGLGASLQFEVVPVCQSAAARSGFCARTPRSHSPNCAFHQRAVAVCTTGRSRIRARDAILPP